MTPGGVASSIRMNMKMAMTTPIPRPSDVTHTAVNARALTSVRAA